MDHRPPVLRHQSGTTETSQVQGMTIDYKQKIQKQQIFRTSSKQWGKALIKEHQMENLGELA